MINVKQISIIAIILVVCTAASVGVHRWWVGYKSNLTAQISAQKQGIKSRDAQIASRDKKLDSLRFADSVNLQAHDRALTQLLAVAAAGWIQAKTDLDASKLSLVPIATVKLLEQKADSTILDCQNLNVSKDQRIANLEAQIVLQDTTRKQMDTTRVVQDSVQKETVQVLRPPWFKRWLSWLDDHALTLIIGGGAGYAVARR